MEFVLAHEILGDIHRLLRKYDASMYANAPEYGYEYPGTLDADDVYLILKSAAPTIKPQLVKSLFAGMVSREYPEMQGNSNFQYLAMVQALLDAGFHPDIRVTSKRQEPKGENSTPLMFAAHIGNREIADELLDKRANVNAQNERGETAPRTALDGGNDEVASLLSAKGAYP